MMKRLLGLLLAILSSGLYAQTGNAGLGTSSPDPSAKFDIVSSSQGFLMPRMSSAQREAIVNPASGLMVYDTDTQTHWYFNGNAWFNLVSPPAPAPSNLVFATFTESSLNSASESVLGSFVIPADLLLTEGESLEFDVMGAVSSDSAVVRLKFSGESLSFPINVQGRFDLRASLFRISPNTYKCSGALVMDGYQTSAYLEGNNDFTLTLPFQLSAEQNTATPSGVTIEGFRISRIR